MGQTNSKTGNFVESKSHVDRLKLIRTYGRVLESLPLSTVGDEADLQWGVENIEKALFEEIALTDDPELRQLLEQAYVLLAQFVPSEDCAAVRAFEGWLTEANEGKFNECPEVRRYSEIQASVTRAMEVRLQHLRGTEWVV